MAIVTLRHYVGNETDISQLEEITSRLKKVSDMKESKRMNFKLKLGTSNWSALSGEINTRIMTCIQKLRETGVDVDYHYGKGSGYALIKAVFDTLGEINAGKINGAREIIIAIDGNQYDVSDKRVLIAMNNIERVLLEDERAFGLSLRDGVVLSEDKVVDAFRRIEELYHRNAFPTRTNEFANPQNISLTEVHPAYLKWGESIPGLYAFNPWIFVFASAAGAIVEDIQRTNLTDYTGDPYFTILFANLGKTSLNKQPYEEVVPTIKTQRGTRFNLEMLTDKARNLRASCVGRIYQKAVKDEEFTEKLGEYFDGGIVKDARERILKGFE